MAVDAQQNGRYQVFNDILLFSDPSIRKDYQRLAELAKYYSGVPRYGILFASGAIILFIQSIAHLTSRTGIPWVSITFLVFGFGHIVMMSLAQPALPRYHNIGAVLLFASILSALPDIVKFRCVR